jgi:signal transduction histidine kinase
VSENRLSNAIDPSSGDETVHVTTRREADQLTIEVADNGHGISPANLSRLLEPLFTTKRDVGTGLGLWVSKGIIENHAGTLTVTSSTDPAHHGTTFTITLPLRMQNV